MAQKLKVNAKPTFTAPVELRIAADNGAVEILGFSAEYRRLRRSEAEDVDAKLRSGEMKDRQLLDLVLVNWSGLVDEQGMPFVFSAENRASAEEDWQGFEFALVTAFLKGVQPAAEKNSLTPPVSPLA